MLIVETTSGGSSDAAARHLSCWMAFLSRAGYSEFVVNGIDGCAGAFFVQGGLSFRHPVEDERDDETIFRIEEPY